MIPIGDGFARIPKLRCNAAVSRILQQTHALAISNFPSDLASELEVVTLVVDGPAPVGLHVNRMADSAQNLIERLRAGFQAHVRHAYERLTGPSGGAHRTVRARGADSGGRFARGHVSDELAIADDVGALRGNSFVVEEKGAQAWPVFRPRIANRVDNLRTIAQMV